MEGKWIPAICPECLAAVSALPGREEDLCPYCRKRYQVSAAAAAFQKAYRSVSETASASGETERHIVGFDIKGGVLRKYNGAAREVEIPGIVTTIGPEAFRGSDIVRAVLPPSVRQIGRMAFAESRRLEKVDGLFYAEVIEDYAFYSCRMLRELDVSGAWKLGEGVFARCPRLEKVSGLEQVSEIPAFAFTGDTSIRELHLDGAEKIGPSALAGCDSLRRIYVSEQALQVQEKSTGSESWCSYTLASSNMFRPGRCPELSEVFADGKPLVLDEKNGSLMSSVRRSLEGSSLADRYIKACRWRSEGRCPYCGGHFRGIFRKTCRQCRRPKDY